MKLRVITDQHGSFVGAGEVLAKPEVIGPFTVHVTIDPMPEHVVHEIEVPNDLRSLPSGEFFDKLKQYLPRKT
jgi:hypothetical protein